MNGSHFTMNSGGVSGGRWCCSSPHSVILFCVTLCRPAHSDVGVKPLVFLKVMAVIGVVVLVLLVLVFSSMESNPSMPRVDSDVYV